MSPIEPAAPTRMPSRSRRWLWALVGLLLAAFAVVAALQWRMITLLESGSRFDTDNIQWSFSQLELEYLRLTSQFRDFARDPSSVDREALQTRYDIFVSRIDLVDPSRTGKLADDDRPQVAALAQLRGFVIQADAYLGPQAARALDAQGASVLVASLIPMAEPIHDMAVWANDNIAQRDNAREAMVIEANRLVILLTLVQTLLLVGCAAVIVRQFRVLERRGAALEHLADDLRQASRGAQAASQAKDRFLANISHELRTPMNAVLGMLDLLQRTSLAPNQADYASKIEGAARSLLGLLNEILDYSKIESGNMQLDAQAFDLDRLLRDLSVVLSSALGAKPVELLFEIDPTTPERVVGDAQRLRQVLLNLGVNAIKFTESGEIALALRVIERGPTMCALQFEVRDSGIGIAPEHHERVFESFIQAEDSTTRRFGGTGLGLSISRRLVGMMGGDIALESHLGQGSSFRFTLRLPLGEAAAEPAMGPAPTPGALRVLIADDHAGARAALAGMAGQLSWHAELAHSGAQAVEMAHRRYSAGGERLDAVFIDWHMPDMDGWEAAMRIRALAGQQRLPIILMGTAQGREAPAHRSMTEKSGVNAFLTKPATASMLRDAVVEARAQLHAAGEGQAAPIAERRARPRRLLGLRLLVVEDNPVNQQVAAGLLRAEGALVELADNGELGVAAVARADPMFDAVLMDIQMPRMDGYAATRAIREELGLNDLPVVAMTANAMPADRAACLAAGMNDHVGKPFETSHLVKVLLHLTASAKALPAGDV